MDAMKRIQMRFVCVRHAISLYEPLWKVENYLRKAITINIKLGNENFISKHYPLLLCMRAPVHCLHHALHTRINNNNNDENFMIKLYLCEFFNHILHTTSSTTRSTGNDVGIFGIVVQRATFHTSMLPCVRERAMQSEAIFNAWMHWRSYVSTCNLSRPSHTQCSHAVELKCMCLPVCVDCFSCWYSCVRRMYFDLIWTCRLFDYFIIHFPLRSNNRFWKHVQGTKYGRKPYTQRWCRDQIIIRWRCELSISQRRNPNWSVYSTAVRCRYIRYLKLSQNKITTYPTLTKLTISYLISTKTNSLCFQFRSS